jgi:hypothetical protein
MNKMYYAHSKEGRPKEEWQTLEEHLKNVVCIVHEFVDGFLAKSLALNK